MNNENVNIILACNNNYVPYLAVTLQSIILFSNRDRKYKINILYTNISSENINKITGMSVSNADIQFVNVSEAVSDKILYTKHHISEETYYRALIPELFPELSKVLYIDCDLVVNRDVAELYDTDISEYILGAVKNFHSHRMIKYVQEEIHIAPEEYFNAGVLLINLDMFKSNDIASKFFEMAHGEKKYNLMDQDFLNILCNKKICYLDPRWNVSWQHVFPHDDDQKILDSYKAEYNKIIADPYIIHYTTEKKAWDYGNMPLADYFWKLARSNKIFMDDYNKEMILLVTHEMDYAGSEHSLKRVSTILKNAGYKVDVWSYQQGDFANEFKKINVTVKFVNRKKLNNPEFTELFKRYKLIIANTVATYEVVNAAQDIVPTIWYIREGQNIPQFYRSDRKLYETLFKAYFVYTVSEYAGDFIVRNYNPNVNIIHNCVDDEYSKYGNDISEKNDKIKLLTMGTIEERKGYDVYFHAYMALPEEYRNRLELHFAGRTAKWAKKYAEELLEEIKPYEGIIYHGEIQDRSILLGLVNDMNVVVVASRDESCSLVALEGAMMKKALLVTENVGAKYIVDKSNGWIVKTGSVEDMAAVYKDIVDSADRLGKMGEASRKKYLETSTFEMLTDNIIEMTEKYKFRSSSQFEKMKSEALKKQYPINMDDLPASLITYDIFDTLITRMTATPKGVFALMQYSLINSDKYKNKSSFIRQNFYELRVNAEACARNALINRQKDEVTLDEIYSALNMTQEMSYSSMKEIEELEKSIEYSISVSIRSNVNEAVKKIKAKLPVSYASDMYLEKEFIRRLLHKADPELSSRKIYVSSNCNRSKASGNMFRYIKNEESIAYSEWIHIGDNALSDFETPKKYGISAKLFSGSKMLQWENDLIRDNESDPNMQLAVGAARNARINSENNSMAFKAGVSVGAISVYAYVRWIIARALNNGINRLYFVARDGYVLKAIADIIIAKNGYKLKTKYIYGSRLTWRLPALCVKPEMFEMIFNESLPHFINTVSDYAEIFDIPVNTMLDFVPNSYKCDDVILDPNDVAVIKNGLMGSRKFKELVCSAHKEKLERVCAYMRQEVDFSDDKFAFVELNGSGFTQYCLSSIISSFYSGRICTFFLKLNSVKKYEKDKVSFINYFPNNIKAAHIVEALCRAPHGQTYGYEKKGGKYYPLIEKSEGEALIKYGFDDYLKGVEAFTEYMTDAEKATGIAVTSCALTKNILKYLSGEPAKEIIDYISDIPFGPTGREKTNVTFAPVLTDEQLSDIYLHKKKLQTVYSGAAFDISLKRCSPEQLAKTEEYKAAAQAPDTDDDKQSKIPQKPNINYINDSEFSNCPPMSEIKTKAAEDSRYTNTIIVTEPELFAVNNFISLENEESNSVILYSGEIRNITDKTISYEGKSVSVKCGDLLRLNEICADTAEKQVWNSWNIYSTGKTGKAVKMRTGLMLIHPESDNFSLLRLGAVIPVPEELKGKKVTLTLRCSNLVNEAQLCFTSKKDKITLASAGMFDDSIRITKDGIFELSSYIPTDDSFIRIMIQIPSKKYGQILVQELKLEEGDISTFTPSNSTKKNFTHILNSRNISDGVESMKKNGIKYILDRLKSVSSGKE